MSNCEDCSHKDCVQHGYDDEGCNSFTPFPCKECGSCSRYESLSCPGVVTEDGKCADPDGPTINCKDCLRCIYGET